MLRAKCGRGLTLLGPGTRVSNSRATIGATTAKSRGVDGRREQRLFRLQTPHRRVGSHEVFAKLGLTSRKAMEAALVSMDRRVAVA